jgi:enoyl-CoA hydratase
MTAFQEAQADPAVRAVALRAEGKLFCPGLDLQDLWPLDRPAMGRFMERFGACVLTLYACPKPVIAAVHGHALAGGCVLALTADWRVSRRGAMLGLNEVKVGVALPFGVAHMLRESVASARMAEIALLGRNFRDEEAVAAGLAHEVAEAPAFEETCRARIEEFASKDAAAFGVTKRYLRSAAIERIRANDRHLLGEWLDGWFSPPTRARVAEIVAGLQGKGTA